MTAHRYPDGNEAILMNLLINGERYGRQLGKDFERTTGRSILAATLYLALDRLEAAGWVKSRQGSPDEVSDRGGNRRRYFKLSGAGHRVIDGFEAALGAARTEGV